MAMPPSVSGSRRPVAGTPAEVDAAVRRRMAVLLQSTIRLSAVESVMVVVLVSAFVALPGHPPVDDTACAVLLAAVTAVTLVLALKLARSPAEGTTTARLFLAWGLIDVGAIAAGVAESGGARSDVYLIYLVLVVFQSGTGFPRPTRILFDSLSVISYLVVLAVGGWHIGTATVVLRAGMIAVLAWGADMLSLRLVAEFRSQVQGSIESQRWAGLWRKVADLTGSPVTLDPEAVLDWVTDAMAELGYDAASVNVVDDDGATYRVVRAFGLPAPFAESVHPRTVGMPGAVLAAGKTTIVDYAHFDTADPAVRALGLRTTIGVPVRTGRTITAVLVVGTHAWRQPPEEELAALQAVAAHAAQGIANARRYADERRDADRLRSILAGAPDAMVVATGPDLVVARANVQASRLFGAATDGLVGRQLTELAAPAARPRLRALALELAGGGADEVKGEQLHALRSDGSAFAAEVTLSPLTTADGPMVAVTFRDISERLAFEERLAHHASHDELTGLPNRSLFLGRLTEVLSNGGQAGPVAVCFLDIDHFKYVNDSRGHGVGDELVAQVAERLRQAAGGELVARFGGDEFALLATGVRDPHEATGWAWRWMAALDKPFLLDGVECHVSASAGVAFGTVGDTAVDVLRRADAAMYAAKQRGRARVELFDDALTARAAWRLDVASALHDAIERRELSLVYQPVVDMESGHVTGLEALLRWDRATGPISPADFIPVAEDSGLIVPIGRWVLHQACRRAAAWFAAAPAGDPLSISVNVSSRQLDHDRLIGDVAEVLQATGIPPGSLVLEITESSFIGDMTAAVRRLDALRRLGVQVVIDDFGTGFSSLSSLSRLPIDGVKIDKSFVDGIGTRYDTVVRAVIDVAKTFGLRVVAEGVERPAQAAQLLALGCRYGQGFLFARPLAEDRVGEVVSRRRCPTTR